MPAGIVLMIEDEPLVALLVSDMLEELGLECLTASDVKAGLALMTVHPVTLVLSDIELPGGMDGLWLARQLKQSHPDLPILLMTGNAERARNARLEFPVLTKPFKIEQLGEAIRAGS